jgi:hypothetical protein
MLSLLLKTVAKSLEVEFIHYLIGIVSHCLRVKELRDVVLNEELKLSGTFEGDYVYNYLALLSRHAEKQSEVISIPKLH